MKQRSIWPGLHQRTGRLIDRFRTSCLSPSGVTRRAPIDCVGHAGATWATDRHDTNTWRGAGSYADLSDQEIPASYEINLLFGESQATLFIDLITQPGGWQMPSGLILRSSITD